jgi:restriction endonuclease S subunit
MTSLPKGWSKEPLIKFIDARSGNGKLIKGKQSSTRLDGLFPAFSASGQDIWTEKAEVFGPGIVVSSVGARCGKTFLADGSWTAVANTHVLQIKAEAPLDIKYLWYLCNDENWWIRSGTAQPFVKVKDTLERPQLLPPLSEQRRIVELIEDHLSRLDAALDDVKQAKMKAAQFRRSLLQAAFSGKFTQDSGAGNANWAISELGELCTFITDGSHNPPKGIEKSEYLMLSSRDINNGELTFDKPRYLSKKDFDSENKRTDLQIDDVLLTTVGTIGRTAIYSGVPKNVTFQRSVSVLRPNKEKISSKFLMYFLDSLTDLLNREARGVAQQGIYLNQVRKLEVPVPSLDEQLFLVELLDNHLVRLDSSCKLADLMENQGSVLRRSLLQAAFTGQLAKEVVSV